MAGFEIIGWLGAIIFVVAYFLLSIHVFTANSVTYHTLNALGAISLVINAIFLNDTPNFFVNFVWMAIALYSIFKIMQKQAAKKKNINY